MKVDIKLSKGERNEIQLTYILCHQFSNPTTFWCLIRISPTTLEIMQPPVLRPTRNLARPKAVVSKFGTRSSGGNFAVWWKLWL